jgi:diguanylate cyclase
MNPTELARETIRRLAAERVPPTPENYARVYAEVSGQAAPEHPATGPIREVAASFQQAGILPNETRDLLQALQRNDWTQARESLSRLAARITQERGLDWTRLVRDLIREWEQRREGFTQARKREALEHVLSAFGSDPLKLHARLGALVASWSRMTADNSVEEPAERQVPAPGREAPGAGGLATPIQMAANERELVPLLREVLAETLTLSVTERLGYTPDLEQDARELAQLSRKSNTVNDVNFLLAQIRAFWVKLELRGEATDQTVAALRKLILLIITNLASLVESESWVHGQVVRVQGLLERGVSREALEAAEASFRDLVHQQSQTKQALDEARDALKTMVGTFIDRFGAVIDSTGDFSGRLHGYAERLQSTNDVPGLSRLMQEMLQDTRSVQADLVRTQEELQSARRRVQEAEEQVKSLESRLDVLSTTVREDPLTRALNRRGLDQALTAEFAREARTGKPLCLALLDVDNFKQLNDKIGHQAGDAALRMLADCVREGIRPTDVLARYGGEEFIILLPDTDLESARQLLIRLQRSLTTRFFTYNNERTFITFSAGIALHRAGESEESLIERADQAMLRAKRSGKNRVELAS